MLDLNIFVLLLVLPIFAGFIFGRYLLMAGLTYQWFYVWKNKLYANRKIQALAPITNRIKAEIRESATTAIVFGIIGISLKLAREAGCTKLIVGLEQFNILNQFCYLILLILIHDTYFYFLHYFMHRNKHLRQFHAIHHRSHNPSPLTALAFHPIEAALEIAIVPIMAFIFPIHLATLMFFASFSLVWNIYGHLGYELFPAKIQNHILGQWLNTSTHHNMHHQDGRFNFGLYFNFWDRLMKTNHPAYKATFKQLAQNNEIGSVLQQD